MKKNKWLTGKEAWELASKLAEKYGNIEAVAKKIGTATSTIYKWGKESVDIPDVRITEKLKELAIKDGIIKT